MASKATEQGCPSLTPQRSSVRGRSSDYHHGLLKSAASEIARNNAPGRRTDLNMNLIPFLFLVPLSDVSFAALAPSSSAQPIPRVASANFTAAGVDEEITAGRALLAEGKNAEALARFEAAEQLEKSFKTRQWVLRGWIATGRVNDALGEIDKIVKTNSTAATDYLYGMAFARMGKNHIADGTGGGVVTMTFDDAVDFLEKATSADPVNYSDAFATLAECAWYAQDLDVARAAAQKSVALTPKDASAWQMLGKIAFSQYQTLREDEARAADAEAAWTAARDAFAKSGELSAANSDAASRALAAEAAKQLGYLHIWKQQGDEAAQHFASAMAVDPSSIDFGVLRDNLTPEQFVKALEDAATQYEQVHGQETTGDAGLLWWLGFAEYSAKRYPEAEAALTRAVAKEPSFVNSWYYIALSRYFRQDYDGAIAALRTQYGLSPDDTAASLVANEAENIRILDYMIGLKAARAANLDAAFLSELQTRMAPSNDRYWNNLGLFLRDEGERRGRRGAKSVTPEEHKQIMDLFERSYAAYLKSLELAPNDPNYLNDAAVMLDYNLDRDLDQARAWYVKAAEMAEIELANTKLDKDTRDLRAIALRDANNNLKLLDAKLEKRRKEQQAREAAEREKAQQEKAGTPPVPPKPTPPKPQ